MSTKTATLVAQLVDQVSKPAAGMAKAMEKAAAQAKALTGLRDGGGSRKLVTDLQKLGASASQIDKVSDSLKKFLSAQNMAGKSADWTKTQAQAVRTWESSVVAAMRDVRREQDATAASARKLASTQLKAAVDAGNAQRRERQRAQAEATRAHQEVIQRRRETMAGVAGAVGGYKVKQFGVNAVEAASDMDKATRYQRVATDVTEAMQKRLLLPQAKRIGQDTEFSNKDIVEAQTATMQSLPVKDADLKAEIGAAIIERVRDYAQVMTAGMTTSAEGLRSFLQTTNKDISTKERAVAEATRGTNLLIKMAKLGGMNDDDVQAAVKRGFPTGTQAGLSDTTLGAVAIGARRGGLRGDEIGTFQRTMASKLIAPTQKGREALIAAGINIDDYTKMPGGLSTETLEKFQKNRFGKTFSNSQRERLADILEDEDGLPSRDDFTAKVSAIVAESFGKTKKGETKAQDAQKIAKMVGDFYKLSVESTDAEGLLMAILSNPKVTPALRNAFFTDKHGGKVGMVAAKMDQYAQDKADLEHVTQDPGLSQRKAAEITGGLYGSLNQLKGAVETLTLSFGEANAGIAKVSFDKLSSVAEALTALPDPAKQAATALAAVGALYGITKGAEAFLGGFGLKSSAAALDASAAALMRAAVAQGGGALPGLGGKATGALGRMGAAGLVGAAGLGIVAIGAGVGFVDATLPNSNRMNGNGAGFRKATGLQSYPGGWGPGGLNVAGGIGSTGGAFTTHRPKTWGETIFGSTRAGTRDPTRLDLPLPAGMGGPKMNTAQIEAGGKVIDEVKAKGEALNDLHISIPVEVPGAGTAIQQLQTIESLTARVKAGLAGVGSGLSTGGASIGRTGNVTSAYQNMPKSV
ncbi:MAG: family phage tail tape measure protein [Methylobacterium brachiatum]|jgi:TP901 family phage tail tape measure protein|nr:family phage tail tape measure protein [Methylobacterium brachiatum]